VSDIAKMAHDIGLALVRVNGEPGGSGTVLSPMLVLTCRHVVDPPDYENFKGYTAHQNVTVDGIKVSKIFRSPEDPCAPLGDVPDLALLLLHEPISGKPVRLLSGPTTSDVLRNQCHGWGFTGPEPELTKCRLAPQLPGLLEEDVIGFSQSTILNGMSGGPILIEGTRDCVGILAQGGIGRAAAAAYGAKPVLALLSRDDVRNALASAGIEIEREHRLLRELIGYVDKLAEAAPGEINPFMDRGSAAIIDSLSAVTAIVGGPGSGKTWMLRQQLRTAIHAVRQELQAANEGAIFPLRNEAPFWLTADELEGPPHWTMQDRLSARLQFLYAQQSTLRYFLESCLQRAACVVLIDEWRKSSTALQESLARWPANRLRRVILATDSTRLPEGASVVTIRSLEPSEIRALVKECIGDAEKAASLLRILEKWQPPLSEVLRVPLLLGVLCRALESAPMVHVPETPGEMFLLLDRSLAKSHEPGKPSRARAQLRECWETVFPPAPAVPACAFSRAFTWQHVQTYKEGKLGRSDASLLVAANEAVRFIGREDLLDSLLSWATSLKPVAIRAIGGQGGAGKTRLALELANRLSRVGWECFWAKSPLGQPEPEKSLARPTLLIFDYASSFKVQLQSASEKLLGYKTVHPLRILLLDRLITGWYQDLLPHGGAHYGVENLWDDAPLDLPPYDYRRELFQEGLDTWAGRHKRKRLICPEPGVVAGFDEGLQSDVWADPLYLLIASFVAAEYERFEPALEKTRLDLVEYAARKEEAELTRRAAVMQGVVSELAAINTLAGGCAMDAAEAIAQAKLGHSAGSRAIDTAVGVLDDMYGDGRGRLMPIQPDPVAEAFVLLQWQNRRNNQRFIDRTLDDAARAANPAAVATFLVRTGQTFGWIQPASQRAGEKSSLRLDVALDALARYLTSGQDLGTPEDVIRLLPASTETVALRALRLRVIESYRKSVPDDTGLILAQADALASMHRHEEATKLLDAEMPHIDSDHQHAHALEIRANSLSALGAREQSIRDLEAAVAIRERSGAELGDLASALSNLANRCSEAGFRESAAAYSLRAVALYRRLAAESRAHFADQLARALCSRATILHDDGRDEESLAALEEGLGIFKDLARENRDRYQPQLGVAFLNASVSFAATGKFAEALNTSKNSVAIFRELDARLAGVFQEQLAVALRDLSAQLRQMGRSQEALDPAREAVEIHERLASSRPARFSRELAESLKALAAVEGGAAAVETLKRALNLIRPLANEDAIAFEPDLSHILATMASSLNEVDRNNEAIPFAKQAVFIDRRLAEAYPPFRFQLAQSLRALAVALTGLQQFDAALSTIQESIEIRRQLGAGHRAGLARALDLQAKLQAALNRPAEALKSSEEALKIMEALIPQSPATHAPGFAHALENHANRLLDSNDFSEALELAIKAILLRCSLIAQNPRQHTIHIAVGLGIAGRALGGVRRFREARVYFAEGARVLLPHMGDETRPMSLLASLVQDYIDVRAEVGDPIPQPLSDKILMEQLFAEAPLDLDGYAPPGPSE